MAVAAQSLTKATVQGFGNLLHVGKSDNEFLSSCNILDPFDNTHTNTNMNENDC